jgi:RNA polymerase sigma-70 factor (ECF subfamily)
MSTPLVNAAFADRLITADVVEPGSAFSREEPRVRLLLHDACLGNREAFGELVALYESVVFRTALAALGRAEDAEDAAQDALVVAWRKLPGFRGDATFRTWLLTIVWRKALDRRRVRRLWWTRTQQSTVEAADDPFRDVAGADNSGEAQAIAREQRARIRAAIVRLTPKLKDALLLASSDAHSYDEIAVILRVPVGTVKWRVSEARRLIKQRLGT